MFLSNLSIKQPVFATMMMAALAVLGVTSYSQLKVDQFPNVEFPIVTVTTQYPGASPEAVEREVTKKIEEAINTVEGIKHVESTSQEGLSNILKHAKARHAKLRLTADAEAVQLDIIDDGAGFELAGVKPSDHGGLGLIGMRERAALLRGDLQIVTEPGAGTHLTIRLPLGMA